jgi:hypothetical protein
MDFRHMIHIKVALGLTACVSVVGAEQQGYETGPCLENQCFDGLVCRSDLCVDEDDADDDADDDDDGATGSASASASASTAASDAESEAETAAASDSDLESTSTSGDHEDDGDVTSGPMSSTGGNDCGDGVVTPGEQCDGEDLQGFDCASLGLGGGTLACDPIMCSFDTSMCMSTSSGTDS